MKRIFAVILSASVMAGMISCSCCSGSEKEASGECAAGQCEACDMEDSCTHVCDSTSVKDPFYRK